MAKYTFTILAASMFLLASCGSETASTDATPSTPVAKGAENSTSDAKLVEAMSIMDRLNAADIANGKRQFIQCKACHTLEENGKHLTGPNLWNILDNPAAGKDGYTYSPALQSNDIVWNVETLDKFIEKPTNVYTGGKMIFRGIANPDKRADLIAYIQQETTP